MYCKYSSFSYTTVCSNSISYMDGCMKRAFFSFAIGLLHYSVFYMIVSSMFEDYSSTVAYCAMWLCIFTSVLGLIGDLIEEKLFISRTDETIKKAVDEFVKAVEEEKKRMKEEDQHD